MLFKIFKIQDFGIAYVYLFREENLERSVMTKFYQNEGAKLPLSHKLLGNMYKSNLN